MSKPTGTGENDPADLSTPPISPVGEPAPVLPLSGITYPSASLPANVQLYYSILARQALLANVNDPTVSSSLPSPPFQPPTSGASPQTPSGQLQGDLDQARNRASRPPNIMIQQHELFPSGNFQNPLYPNEQKPPNNLPMTPYDGLASFFNGNGPLYSPFMFPFGGYNFQSPMVQPSPVQQDQFVYPPPPIKAAVAPDSSSSSSPARLPQGLTTVVGFRPHFCKGALIRLSDDTFKLVEDMKTQDFISCAKSTGNKLNKAKILSIKACENNNSVLVTFDTNGYGALGIEAPFGNPFFIYDKGWSAYCPDRCKEVYGLDARKLSVGDDCITLLPTA